MAKFLAAVHDAVWGVPTLFLILALGIMLTLSLEVPQIRLLPRAFRLLRENGSSSDVLSPRQALCTALGATVGTGNIIGVAGAICIGGPGTVFWIWVFGFFGMAVKFAEVVLSMHYRTERDGEYLGGPMYMITQGLGSDWKPLAQLYCVLGLGASLGIGNAVQVNALCSGFETVLMYLHEKPFLSAKLIFGALLASVVGMTMINGASGIGKTAERIVPFSAGFYCILCLGVLLRNRHAMTRVFQEILAGAFSPTAVTGGMISSAFSTAQVGASRGAFSNEAGMGTASIAHVGAYSSDPVSQGVLGMAEVLIDTMVVCTLTALSVLSSGVQIPFGQDAGPSLAIDVFAQNYGRWSVLLISLLVSAFAFATILGWGLYGIRFFEFLFGRRFLGLFLALQMVVIVLSAVLDTASVWRFAETLNGLMMYPVLFTLFILSPELVRITSKYNHGE